MNIIQHSLAVTSEPVRKHKKRHNQTKAYHARIQKKWIKRFGQRKVPGCWQTRDAIYIHPELFARLKLQTVLGGPGVRGTSARCIILDDIQ